MSNMSYCRFRNTLSDLADCHENMEEDPDLDYDEAKARIRLVKLCQQIVMDYEDDLEQWEEDLKNTDRD